MLSVAPIRLAKIAAPNKDGHGYAMNWRRFVKPASLHDDMDYSFVPERHKVRLAY